MNDTGLFMGGPMRTLTKEEQDAFDAILPPDEDATIYVCEMCGAEHKQEFSLTCPSCDRRRESGGEELK